LREEADVIQVDDQEGIVRVHRNGY
jgi:hypothetical protein